MIIKNYKYLKKYFIMIKNLAETSEITSEIFNYKYWLFFY